MFAYNSWIRRWQEGPWLPLQGDRSRCSQLALDQPNQWSQWWSDPVVSVDVGESTPASSFKDRFQHSVLVGTASFVLKEAESIGNLWLGSFWQNDKLSDSHPFHFPPHTSHSLQRCYQVYFCWAAKATSSLNKNDIIFSSRTTNRIHVRSLWLPPWGPNRSRALWHHLPGGYPLDPKHGWNIPQPKTWRFIAGNITIRIYKII